jgi:ornithine carbamoyltransferase
MSHLLAGDPLPEAERRALLQTARRLHRAALDGRDDQPLRGRHVAIACSATECPEARVLEEAARRLGARVSRIGFDALCRGDDQAALARMLGSLYDAVDCCSLGAERALELQRLSGVPVFDGLGDSAHRLRDLLPELDELDASGADKLTRLLQAVLVETVA